MPTKEQIQPYIDEIKAAKVNAIVSVLELYGFSDDINYNSIDEFKLHDGFQRTLERYLKYPGSLTDKELDAIISLYSPGQTEVVEGEEDQEDVTYIFVPAPYIRAVSGVPFTIPTLTDVPVPQINAVSGVGDIVPGLTYIPVPHINTVFTTATPEPVVFEFIPVPQVVEVERTDGGMTVQYANLPDFNPAEPLGEEILALFNQKNVNTPDEFEVEFKNEYGYLAIAIPADAPQPKNWSESPFNNGSMSSVFAEYNIEIAGRNHVLYVTKEKSQWGQEDEDAIIMFHNLPLARQSR